MESKLEELKTILLPAEYETDTPEGPLMTSDDPYDNLQGAIIDLKRQGADEVCIHTCEKIARRILAAQKILDDHQD